MIAMISLQSMIAQRSFVALVATSHFFCGAEWLHSLIATLTMKEQRGTLESTIRGVPHPPHSTPPTPPVTPITPARENYHRFFFLEADKGERHYV
jgi:hypothetical protein